MLLVYFILLYSVFFRILCIISISLAEQFTGSVFMLSQFKTGRRWLNTGHVLDRKLLVKCWLCQKQKQLHVCFQERAFKRISCSYIYFLFVRLFEGCLKKKKDCIRLSVLRYGSFVVNKAAKSVYLRGRVNKYMA